MKKKKLKDRLDIANETIEYQLEDIVGLHKMEKHYDSHMEIAENEIKRLNVIIHYLETKDMK